MAALPSRSDSLWRTLACRRESLIALHAAHQSPHKRLGGGTGCDRPPCAAAVGAPAAPVGLLLALAAAATAPRALRLCSRVWANAWLSDGPLREHPPRSHDSSRGHWEATPPPPHPGCSAGFAASRPGMRAIVRLGNGLPSCEGEHSPPLWADAVRVGGRCLWTVQGQRGRQAGGRPAVGTCRSGRVRHQLVARGAVLRSRMAPPCGMPCSGYLPLAVCK